MVNEKSFMRNVRFFKQSLRARKGSPLLCLVKFYLQSDSALRHRSISSLIKSALSDPNFRGPIPGTIAATVPKQRSMDTGAFPCAIDLLTLPFWYNNEGVSVPFATALFWCLMKVMLQDATKQQT